MHLQKVESIQADTSQAASVSNECLNPILDSNSIDNIVDVGNCGGTVSQQDESGSASAPITSQTANPTIELQRATTTQPPPTEEPPGPEGFGTVEFSILSCDDCRNPLRAIVTSVGAIIASPSEFTATPDPGDPQEITFESPSAPPMFIIELDPLEEPQLDPTNGSACSPVTGPTGFGAVTGNIPPAGTTVTCEVNILPRIP